MTPPTSMETSTRRKGWSPLRSAGHAYGGLFWIVARAPSVRFGVVASAAAVALALIFRFTLVELLLVVLGLTITLAAEILNTTIEMLCDELRPDPDPAIGRIKDVAAGATAISEVGVTIVGLLVIAHHVFGWFTTS